MFTPRDVRGCFPNVFALSLIGWILEHCEPDVLNGTYYLTHMTGRSATLVTRPERLVPVIRIT